MENDTPKAAWVHLGIYLARAQAAIYVVSGLWPVFSIKTFEMVTGPKVDRWLVKTVGLLLAAMGLVFGRAGFRTAPTAETALLGATGAAALTGIDVVYAAKGRISKVYLLDALLELPFVAGWAWWLYQRSQSAESRSLGHLPNDDASAAAENQAGAR